MTLSAVTPKLFSLWNLKYFQLSKELDYEKGKVLPACLPPKSGLIIVNKLFILVIFRSIDAGGFSIEGKTAMILGWGGTIDKANATSQLQGKQQCDLLKADTQVKHCICHAMPLPRWTMATGVQHQQTHRYVLTMKMDHRPKHVMETAVDP